MYINYVNYDVCKLYSTAATTTIIAATTVVANAAAPGITTTCSP